MAILLSVEEAGLGNAAAGGSPRPSTSNKQENMNLFGGPEVFHSQAEAYEDKHRDPASAINSAEKLPKGSSGSLVASMLSSGLGEPLPAWPSQKFASAASGLFVSLFLPYHRSYNDVILTSIARSNSLI